MMDLLLFNLLLLQRIKIDGIRRDLWFQRNYMAARLKGDEEVNLDDVHAVFNDIEVQSLSVSSFRNLAWKIYREKIWVIL